MTAEASPLSPTLSPRERLLATLRRQPVDRPPVICTGGSMTAAALEVIGTDAPLPAAHTDPVLMAGLCTRIQTLTGFENLGTPLCMTMEAEALGAGVDLGSPSREATVGAETFAGLADARLPDPVACLARARVPVVLRATRILADRRPDMPVIANLNGPTSVATALVPAAAFLKGTRRAPAEAHRLVSEVTAVLCALAGALIAHGAAVIAIHDDTATPDLLGPALFEQYTVRYLTVLIDHVQAAGVPVILHLCGDLVGVAPLLVRLAPDAVSVDAATSVAVLKRAAPGLLVMGNVSSTTLHLGEPDVIAAQARHLHAVGVDILAPGCGLGLGTPLANIRALTRL